VLKVGDKRGEGRQMELCDIAVDSDNGIVNSQVTKNIMLVTGRVVYITYTTGTFALLEYAHSCLWYKYYIYIYSCG